MRAPPKQSNRVLVEISVTYRGNGVDCAQTIELPEGYEADPQAMAFWLKEQLHRELLEAGRKRTVESGRSVK